MTMTNKRFFIGYMISRKPGTLTYYAQEIVNNEGYIRYPMEYKPMLVTTAKSQKAAIAKARIFVAQKGAAKGLDYAGMCNYLQARY